VMRFILTFIKKFAKSEATSVNRRNRFQLGESRYQWIKKQIMVNMSQTNSLQEIRSRLPESWKTKLLPFPLLKSKNPFYEQRFRILWTTFMHYWAVKTAWRKSQRRKMGRDMQQNITKFLVFSFISKYIRNELL